MTGEQMGAVGVKCLFEKFHPQRGSFSRAGEASGSEGRKPC